MIKATQEERESIQISPTDHAHFTNRCGLCGHDVSDDKIFPIKIDRRSGLDMQKYSEQDYCCETCLIELGIKHTYTAIREFISL